MDLEETTLTRAGNAMIWKAVQFFGDKAIFLVRLLILARLLSPDDFGLWAIAGVMIEVLLGSTNFGMVPALVQRLETNQEHFDVAWTVGILRALGIMVATILAAPIVAGLFAEPRATNIMQVLAIYPLIDAGASIRVAELMRSLNFRELAYINLAKAIMNTIAAIGLAKMMGVWALVVGNLAGSTAYLIFSYLIVPYRPRLNLNRYAARSLIQFGQWIFFTNLTAMAGQVTLRLVIARILGASELGLYYLATRLAFLPADIATQVVGQVSFPFYSRLQQNKQEVSHIFRSILISLSALLVPMCVLLIALAPSLVENILGSDWQGTADIIRVLAFASIVGLLGSTIVPILQGMGRPNRILVIEATQSMILVILAWLLTNQYGVVGTAFAWIPAIGLAQIACILFLSQILPRPFIGLRTPLGVIISISCIAGILAWFVDSLLPGVFGFVIGSLTGIILIGLLIWTLERRFSLGISDGLVQAFPHLAILFGSMSS